MDKKNAICLLLIFLFACEASQTPKISLDKMKLLMWDLTVADNLYQQQQFRDTNLQRTNLQEKYYQRVFQTHQVVQSDFLSSYNYYKQHPNLLKILLDSVENFGNRQKNKRIEVK